MPVPVVLGQDVLVLLRLSLSLSLSAVISAALVRGATTAVVVAVAVDVTLVVVLVAVISVALDELPVREAVVHGQHMERRLRGHRHMAEGRKREREQDIVHYVEFSCVAFELDYHVCLL
jgi:hypothetical protein